MIEPVIQPGTYTVISESIEFPEGYRLAPLKNKSYQKNGLIYGTIALYDLLGNQVAMIRPLLCFDAQNNYTLGGYKIQKEGNLSKIIFNNNDRPGIMLSNSTKKYLNKYGVAPGKNLVFFTNNDSAYETAIDFFEQGIKVEAIVDTRDSSDGSVSYTHLTLPTKA